MCLYFLISDVTEKCHRYDIVLAPCVSHRDLGHSTFALFVCLMKNQIKVYKLIYTSQKVKHIIYGYKRMNSKVYIT